MTTVAPLADIESEAERLTSALAGRGLDVRLIGGLAVARHRHRPVPATLQRSYGDIDLVIHPKQGKAFRAAMVELGYTPNVRFNNMRGDRRLLYADEPNDRKLDVFVGGFQMCHGMDLSSRLNLHPLTLAPADLLLTKLQVVHINYKDLLDAVTLLPPTPRARRPRSRPGPTRSTVAPTGGAGHRSGTGAGTPPSPTIWRGSRPSPGNCCEPDEARTGRRPHRPRRRGTGRSTEITANGVPATGSAAVCPGTNFPTR